jgi:hypothetical protein
MGAHLVWIENTFMVKQSTWTWWVIIELIPKLVVDLIAEEDLVSLISEEN